MLDEVRPLTGERHCIDVLQTLVLIRYESLSPGVRMLQVEYQSLLTYHGMVYETATTCRKRILYTSRRVNKGPRIIVKAMAMGMV